MNSLRRKYPKVRLLPILLLSCLVFSCTPLQRFSRLVRNHPELIKTGTDTLIVYRDTVIAVPIPGTPVVSMGVKLQDFLSGIRITVKSGTSVASAYVKDSTVFVESSQRDSTYQVKIDSLQTIIQIRDTQIVTLKEKATFWNRLERIFWLVLAITLIVFFIRIFKK